MEVVMRCRVGLGELSPGVDRDVLVDVSSDRSTIEP
jgi:hypothetical protein